MNLAVCLVLWLAIGLLCGFLVNWTTGARACAWFWLDLLLGSVGAVLCGYGLSNALFDLSASLGAFSLLFAMFGALAALALLHLIARFFH